MNDSKHKILYISLLAILLCGVLYSSYSLILYGSPTIKSRRLYNREGNRLYNDSLYDDAIEPYLRALEIDENNSCSNFNSATNLLMKIYTDQKDMLSESPTKIDSALFTKSSEMFAKTYEIESNAVLQSEAMHNLGVLNHITNELEKAAEAYKEALRKNPADEETRYNLAVVLYMMKNNQQGGGQSQQDQEQEEQEQQQQQNQQNQQQQQEQQEQQDQQNQQDEEQQQQQQGGGYGSQKDEETADKEEAERILNAISSDEKEIMERMQNRNGTDRRLQNNW